MYSTIHNTTSQIPSRNQAAILGKYLTYPDTTGGRVEHGGLRTTGCYKHSLPGMPLVTVVTVCLNAARNIENCLSSVFRQTYRNIEFIIIDGVSTDGTLDLIKEHAQAIDYFVSEPDRGLYHAMNKGLELASGDYILVLNSDDYYSEDCVESLVNAQIRSGASFTSALAQVIDDSGNSKHVIRSMPFDESVRIRMPLRHETMLLSAAIYNDIGYYDEAFGITADFKHTIRLFEKGYTLYEIPRPLLFFRNSGVSSTRTGELLKERENLLKEQFPFLDGPEVSLLADRTGHTAEQLRDLANKYRAHSSLIESLDLYIQDNARNSQLQNWASEKERLLVSSAESNRPKISVILAVYNAEATLRQCIDSILAQTFSDFELICINDVSSDRSQEIIESYRAIDNRVVSLINNENKGCGATRNRGVRQAKGAYVFHIDPDDTIPQGALQALYSHAEEHGSDMVKGAYFREQLIHGKKPTKPERVSLCADSESIINTTLRQTPKLLRTTEGHWSYLYKSELAKKVFYPIDLKMGQDSIFIVTALAAAERITVIDKVVYHYQVNPFSAMNTFNFRKFMDALEWRRRAWHVLDNVDLREIGDRLLSEYWGETFFANFAKSASIEQIQLFFDSFRRAFAEAGIPPLRCRAPDFLETLFRIIRSGKYAHAKAFMGSHGKREQSGEVGTEVGVQDHIQANDKPFVKAKGKQLKIATFCSMDHGGAGTGTQRRVAALRGRGVDARIFSLVVKSSHPYVKRIVPELSGVDNSQQLAVWQVVRQRAILRAKQTPGFCANELFSLTDSVVDFRKIKNIINEFDIIHLHWVVGMFDYPHAGDCLAEKPVVWTLADMNAFTGGCHYSEGCGEYEKECRKCPLLGGKSNLAHETWKIKNTAYRQLRNLQIICPSQWLAERARNSTLFGSRPVHYIPNALSLDQWKMTNKTVARIRLGLPLNKKLLLFGADRLDVKRKGGDLLKKALDTVIRRTPKTEVEILVFGNNSIDLPLPVNHLKYISDSDRMAEVYSASDAFLFPSREDNAPLMVGESLICGTPVVSFPVGHVPDIIEHGKNGYIAKYLDTDDFADGIIWALNIDKKTSMRMALHCRISASSFHDSNLAVERHLKVYQEAIGKLTDSAAPQVKGV
ncbi:MAG: glycosyltransferase [Chromatiaceae bacterium]|nr:glycosyltransferase [Chromatiaceae bacterium]